MPGSSAMPLYLGASLSNMNIGRKVVDIEEMLRNLPSLYVACCDHAGRVAVVAVSKNTSTENVRSLPC